MRSVAQLIFVFAGAPALAVEVNLLRALSLEKEAAKTPPTVNIIAESDAKGWGDWFYSMVFGEDLTDNVMPTSRWILDNMAAMPEMSMGNWDSATFNRMTRCLDKFSDDGEKLILYLTSMLMQFDT